MLRIRPLTTSFPRALHHHHHHHHHHARRAITTVPVPQPPPLDAPYPPIPPTTTTTTTTAPKPKPKGDISSVFPSLSNLTAAPLEPRFADVKARLLARCDARKLQASWERLLAALEVELAEIKAKQSAVIPVVEFRDLGEARRDEKLLAEIRKRGCVVVKGVVPEEEALQMKEDVRRYIAANQTRVKAFPKTNPSVYELYFSPSQIRARTHPHLYKTHQFLLGDALWRPPPPTSGIDTSTPISYADRLRIRPPGDAGFSLGPHIDGGSLERWEDPAYASVYAAIWAGEWERYDPFDKLELRERANMDLYNGAGACSMLRMWQGWLSMSNTGPTQGTLLLHPLLPHTTAYTLLRPFFSSSTNTPPPPPP